MSGSSKKLVLAISAVALCIALVVWLFNWNLLRGYAEHRVSASTGRETSIGHLGVKLGWEPAIRFDAVRIGNVPDSSNTDFFTADAVTLTVRLLALLHGQVLLPEVTLERPRLVLERIDKGDRNWVFGKGGRNGDTLGARIERLIVHDGTVYLNDAITRTELKGTVETGSDQRASFKATGKYRGNPFEATGRGGGLLSLTDTGHPYPLAIAARAGRTKASFDGTVTGIATLEGLDGALVLSGTDLGDLYPLLDIALPHSPSYELRAHLKRTSRLWQLPELAGRIGSSDISGSLDFDQSQSKPSLRASLASKSLDIVDLGGFIGAEPKSARSDMPGHAGTSKPPAQTGRTASASGRLFPNTQFDLQKLNAMNADVTLVARQIKRRAGLPLDNLSTHLQLQDGHLQLKPLTFGIAGGEIRSALGIDVRTAPIVLDGDVEVHRLQLSRLMPEVKSMQAATGQFGGTAQLHGRGNSFAQILGSADGHVGVAMSGGQISRLLVDLGGLDLGGAFLGTFKSKKTIDIRCAAAAFKVQGGVMTAESLVFDTTDTNFLGEGSISLKDETLDVTLRPEPKDVTLGVLRTPILISGPFANPRVMPVAGPLAVRVGAAALLGAINPIAALLAFVETAPGKDANCGALASRVQQLQRSGVATAQRSAARDVRNGRGAQTLPPIEGK